MTQTEDQREPVDGPEAGGASQGEPGSSESGVGADEGRERRGDPEPSRSTNEKADDTVSVSDPGGAEGNP